MRLHRVAIGIAAITLAILAAVALGGSQQGSSLDASSQIVAAIDSGDTTALSRLVAVGVDRPSPRAFASSVRAATRGMNAVDGSLNTVRGGADEAEFVVSVKGEAGLQRLHGYLHNEVVGHPFGVPWRYDRQWRLSSMTVVSKTGAERNVLANGA